MEKISSFDQVVGNIPESEKDKILRNKGERFDNQVFEELIGKEREKTSEELEIISFANEATNEVRRKYGLEDFDIPSKNIHVVTEEAWPREKSTAFYNSMVQGIAMREKMSKLAFMKTVFHEMLHFKSYGAAQITTGENTELDEYRLGLTVHTRDGKKLYFINLNEAVTEEMTKRFASELLKKELFADEIAQTQDVIRNYPQATTDSGKPLFDEDTFYAEVQESQNWRDATDRLFGRRILGSGVTNISIEGFTYKAERKILNTLIDKIFERNPEEFYDREEVFEVFVKGMITGNILPIGRLIEQTFENGTLRKIGELDNDIQAQEKFVNSL